LSYRGHALVRLDRLEEALAAFDQALVHSADHLESLIGRGNTLLLLKRPDDARAAFDRVLALRPDNAMALGNRGLALGELGRQEDALASLGMALQIAPDNFLWLNHYGRALLLLDRHEDALAVFDRGLALAPDYPDLLAHRAEALRNLRRHDEALLAYDRLLAVDPSDAKAIFNRGKSLWTLGRLTDAIASFEQAAAQGDARALGELAFSRLAIADWAGARELTGRLRDAVAAGDFVHSFVSIAFEFPAAEQLRVVRRLMSDVVAAVPSPFVHATPRKADKLRIAYLSSDFWQHPVGAAVVELFERHDRARFEIVGMSYGPDDQSET